VKQGLIAVQVRTLAAQPQAKDKISEFYDIHAEEDARTCLG
jgi:hypothetical protein